MRKPPRLDVSLIGEYDSPERSWARHTTSRSRNRVEPDDAELADSEYDPPPPPLAH